MNDPIIKVVFLLANNRKMCVYHTYSRTNNQNQPKFLYLPQHDRILITMACLRATQERERRKLWAVATPWSPYPTLPYQKERERSKQEERSNPNQQKKKTASIPHFLASLFRFGCWQMYAAAVFASAVDSLHTHTHPPTLSLPPCPRAPTRHPPSKLLCYAPSCLPNPLCPFSNRS